MMNHFHSVGASPSRLLQFKFGGLSVSVSVVGVCVCVPRCHGLSHLRDREERAESRVLSEESRGKGRGVTW
eukprot:1771928-Rhodomonas_salina.1